MIRRVGVGIAGGAAVIAVLTLLSRGAGFGRWLVFSDSVGAQCVGYVYGVANQMPNVLFEVVAGGALAGAVVPLLAGPLSRAREQDGAPGAAAHRGEADRIASALLTWALLLLAPVAVLLAVGARPLMDVLVRQDQCPGAHQLGARMLLVFAPQVVLYGFGVVLGGVLQAHHRFVWPALGPLLSSVVVMGAYLGFAATVGPHRDDPQALSGNAEAWLAWGTTAGVAVMTLPLLLPVARTGTRLRPTLRFPPGVGRRAAGLASAGVVTLLAQQASVLAVVVLSGTGSTSTLNVFQYTQAVYLLPYAVLVVPLATSAFPRLASAAATGDAQGYAGTAARTTRAVLLSALAGAAVLVAVSAPVGRFFGLLDPGDVSAMTPALVAMAPGLVGFALVAHVGRALYAQERGRLAATATAGGWASVVVAMALLVPLVPDDRVVVALAAGSSAGMVVAGVALLVALRRVGGPAALAGLARTAAGCGAACVVAAGAGWWVGDAAAGAWGSGLLGAVVAGAVAMVVCTLLVVAGVALLDRPTLSAARQVRRRVPRVAAAGRGVDGS